MSYLETKYTMGLNPQGEPEQFPQLWMNKRSGQIFIVVPWWDMMADDILLEGRMNTLDAEANAEQRFKIGGIAQVGWLIENGSGIWFGIGTNAIEHFEKLGEL